MDFGFFHVDPSHLGERFEEPCVSVDTLLARCEEIQAQWPARRAEYRQDGPEYPAVEVRKPNGDTMCVCLGGAKWHIVCWSKSESRLRVNSTVGDESAQGWFEFFCPDWGLISETAMIAAEAGREVVREWLESGQLCDQVEWEMSEVEIG